VFQSSTVASATGVQDLLPLVGPVAIGTAVLIALRWRMNVMSLPEEEARTVNGMILEVLEDIPLPNTTVHIGHYAIDILDVQENMIKQVRVTPQKPLKESVGS